MRRILASAFIFACAVPLAPAQSGEPEKISSGVWLGAASTLPGPDRWWFPDSRPELRQQGIETVYLELTAHQPAGAVPHEWK